MLIWLIVIYLVVSIAIGLLAARRVHSARDFITAGRNLPFFVVFATVFATWFGAETVLGISGTFVKEGFAGLVSDPVGASLCLVLVGLFFARPLYRMNLLTIGDFYRARYNRPVELLVSIAIALSYLGWVSAQVTALGLVFNLLTDGAISKELGMLIGIAVVLLYTLAGGMWSVAFTTVIQMTVIVIGLLYIAWLASDMAGGTGKVIAAASEAGKFEFWPELSLTAILTFLGLLLTMGFGSIPQQDVFQRVNAAKNENTAAWGSIAGGVGYFLFAAIPLFLAYAATMIDPKLLKELTDGDPQLVIPALVGEHMPLYAQVIFYGALLSVIMSTASGTLLAPSVTIAENILKPVFPSLTDAQFLRLTRVVVAVFAGLVLVYCLQSNETIHDMVVNAYKVTLCTAFVPLVFGIYWRRATTQGAMLAIVAGLLVWLGCEWIGTGDIPPQLFGLAASLLGMLVGSLAPQLYGAGEGRHIDTSAGAIQPAHLKPRTHS